jgi:hypothetical protein
MNERSLCSPFPAPRFRSPLSVLRPFPFSLLPFPFSLSPFPHLFPSFYLVYVYLCLLGYFKRFKQA